MNFINNEWSVTKRFTIREWFHSTVTIFFIIPSSILFYLVVFHSVSWLVRQIHSIAGWFNVGLIYEMEWNQWIEFNSNFRNENKPTNWNRHWIEFIYHLSLLFYWVIGCCQWISVSINQTSFSLINISTSICLSSLADFA